MIPEKLTIQGLYSYREKVEIDFQLLTQAKLFGIFGHVGSGKSSILEAITFALFGETERLNNRENRNYNMMNLKSDNLVIDFQFSSGKEKEQFRATATGRRNRKNYDIVTAINRSFYKLDNEAWVPVEEAALHEAIGLSYQNFRRTVIIPQGKFQEFLQMGNADRTRMMKDLFGLEKYEFIHQTKALDAKNKSALNNIEGQLQQLGELQPEALDKMKGELLEKEKNNLDMQGMLQVLSKEVQKYEELKTLITKQHALTTESKQLEAQKPAMERREKQLTDVEYCTRHFKNLLHNQHETEKQQSAYLKQIDTNKSEKIKLDRQIKNDREALTLLQPEYEKKDRLQREIDELQLIAEISLMLKGQADLEERIKKGTKHVQQEQEQQQSLKKSLTLEEQNLKKQKSELEDVSLLYKIKEWYSLKANMEKDLEKAARELKGLLEEQEQILKHLKELYRNGAFKDMSDTTKTEDGLNWLSKQKEANTIRLTGLQKKLEEVLIKEKLEEFTHQLKQGEACPLCGATEHPEILTVENVSMELAAVRKSISDIDKENEALQHFNNQLSNWQLQLSKVGEQTETAKNATTEIRKKLESHNALFTWEKYTDENDLTRAIAQSEKAQQEIKSKEQQLETLRTQAEKLESNIRKYESKLKEIEHQAVAKQSESKTLSGQLRLLKFDDYKLLTAEQLKTLTAEKQEKLITLIKRFEDLSKQLETWQSKADTLTGLLTADEKSLQGIRENLSKLNSEVEQQLQASKWNELSEIQKLLDLQLNTETERSMIQEYRTKVQVNLSQLEENQKQIGKRKYEPDAHLALQNKIEQLNKDIKESLQQTGELKTKISTLEKAIVSQHELLAEQEKLTLRAEDLKTMLQLFKSSGFVDYISSVHLNNLCKSANERFRKMTRQQLSLELNDNNAFLVRDYMNGGKIRSVKTLSGGQTFQASLALALALSDNIRQSGNMDENFFFLDEGFGSLDKESLQVVFETLKSLRKENRIVGIISHVEELQQEIPNYIMINNDSEKGSSVQTSWRG